MQLGVHFLTVTLSFAPADSSHHHFATLSITSATSSFATDAPGRFDRKYVSGDNVGVGVDFNKGKILYFVNRELAREVRRRFDTFGDRVEQEPLSAVKGKPPYYAVVAFDPNSVECSATIVSDCEWPREMVQQLYC